jgi:hypothetical protein
MFHYAFQCDCICFVSAQLILVLILTPSIQVSGFVNSTVFVVLICVDILKKSITVSVWTEIFLYLVYRLQIFRGSADFEIWGTSIKQSPAAITP